MQTIKKRAYAVPKQPEQEIMTLAHTISGFLKKYKRLFISTVSVIAAILVLSAGYVFLQNRQEKKAAPLVAAAYEFYKPSNGTAGDYKKALYLFRDIQKKYSDTTSGAIAQYYVGNCLVSLGQTEEALKEYGAFAKQYTRNKLLLGLVYQRMGFAYQTLGKPDDARKSFEQSETLLGPGVATVELARLYEAAGNMPEAEKKYKVVMEKLAGTTWGMQASSKVQTIAPLTTPAAGVGTK